jgi:CPA2 family monovalent cation:H+ antiporter-2
MIGAFNASDREAMLKVADVHRLDIPPHENEAYVARVAEFREEFEQSLGAEMTRIREGG